MEKKSAFTSRNVFLALLGLGLLILLSGCQQAGTGGIQEITSGTPGFFNHYFVYPFSLLLKTFAEWFQGSYGLSIILVTLMIRFVLLPFALKQSKDQMHMKGKMAKAQPELSVIQEKMKKAKDAETKTKLQQETMKVYQKHQINPLAALGGCLPLLIQLPFLTGFYYAIQRTPEIAQHSFLWFNLGSPNLVLTLLAAGIYFLQARVSLVGLEDAQKKQMAMFSYLSPVMIGMFSLTAPAALPLYWTIGGMFVILQTLLTKKLFHADSSRNRKAEAPV
ncbi:membrane protein insertase YidC [Metabacillus indicus]|uniref:membrane protein insertase YidC n=1 Tax=Metabacillus indicus TaxID=246786 RepID=UPI0031789E0E